MNRDYADQLMHITEKIRSQFGKHPSEIAEFEDLEFTIENDVQAILMSGIFTYQEQLRIWDTLNYKHRYETRGERLSEDLGIL